MKADIHPDYHMIKVVMTNGHGVLHPLDLRRRGRDAQPRHRPQHPSGLDRRVAAAAGPRRPTVALQHPLRRHSARREEASSASGARASATERRSDGDRAAAALSRCGRWLRRAARSSLAYAQPLACSSVAASRMMPTWPFQNTRSPRRRGASASSSGSGCAERRLLHVAVARRRRSGRRQRGLRQAGAVDPLAGAPAPQIGRLDKALGDGDEIGLARLDRREMPGVEEERRRP